MMWTPVDSSAGLWSNGVAMPDERLSWPRTIGIGLQHVVAMFGAIAIYQILHRLAPAR